MMGMFFFLTQFLRGVLGYSDLVTGFAFVPLTADGVHRLAALGARASSTGSARHRLMIIGITFSTLGMLWLTQLGEHSGYVSLVGPLLVFGTGQRAGLRPADHRGARRRRRRRTPVRPPAW